MEKKKKKSIASRSSFVAKIQTEHELPVLERIKFPIIWERITSGYRIQDLQPSRIDTALELIKEHYVHDESLCKGVNLASSKAGVEEFLAMVTCWLKDTLSLAAVQDGTGTFVGLLVARVLDRTVRTQSRMMLFESDVGSADIDAKQIDDFICPPIPCVNIPRIEKDASSTRKSLKYDRSDKKTKIDKSSKSKEFKKSDVKTAKTRSGSERSGRSLEMSSTYEFKIQNYIKWKLPMFDDEFVIYEDPLLMKIHRFRSHLMRKVDILNIYDVDSYYCIHMLYVLPEHRGYGIGNALLRSAIDLTKKVGCEIIAAFITNMSFQNIAFEEGFRVLEELEFSTWLEDDKPVFVGLTDGTKTSAVMVYRFEEPSPPQPTPNALPPRRKTKMPIH